MKDKSAPPTPAKQDSKCPGDSKETPWPHQAGGPASRTVHAKDTPRETRGSGNSSNKGLPAQGILVASAEVAKKREAENDWGSHNWWTKDERKKFPGKGTPHQRLDCDRESEKNHSNATSRQPSAKSSGGRGGKGKNKCSHKNEVGGSKFGTAVVAIEEIETWMKSRRKWQPLKQFVLPPCEVQMTRKAFLTKSIRALMNLAGPDDYIAKDYRKGYIPKDEIAMIDVVVQDERRTIGYVSSYYAWAIIATFSEKPTISRCAPAKYPKADCDKPLATVKRCLEREAFPLGTQVACDISSQPCLTRERSRMPHERLPNSYICVNTKEWEQT